MLKQLGINPRAYIYWYYNVIDGPIMKILVRNEKSRGLLFWGVKNMLKKYLKKTKQPKGAFPVSIDVVGPPHEEGIECMREALNKISSPGKGRRYVQK